MQIQTDVKARYQAAINTLVERLQEDYYVLAAIIYGSVARGEPWERSDLDMMVILRDGQERESRHAWLVEDDINISADVMTRNEFKRALEGQLQGSMLHSIRSQSKLLFTKDESIALWLNDSSAVGKHDQEFQLLRSVSNIFWTLDKATKWFKVKRDMNYCFLWVLYTVNSLANVEVVLHGEAPGREALDQAMKINPAFFQALYIDLINGPKSEAALGAAIDQIEQYLDERASRVFKPILDYLNEAGGPVTAREMSAHFKKKLQSAYLDGAYEYLWRKGIIQKLSSPIHLTRKSTVTLDEPAYYYDTGDVSDWE